MAARVAGRVLKDLVGGGRGGVLVPSGIVEVSWPRETFGRPAVNPCVAPEGYH